MKYLYKNIAIVSLVIIALNSCVSKKKYAELEREIETIKTKNAVETVNQQNRFKTIEEYERVFEEMETELNQTQMKLEQVMVSYEAAGGAPIDQESIERIRSEQEEKQMQNQEQEQNEELMKKLLVQDRNMRYCKQALEKAIQNYSGSEMKLVQKNGLLILSINRSILFQNGETELSATGVTALNRIGPGLKSADDMRINVMAISANGESKENSEIHNRQAFQIANSLREMAELKGKKILPSQVECADAYGSQSNCDRFDIVIEQNYEEAINTLRYQPKY